MMVREKWHGRLRRGSTMMYSLMAFPVVIGFCGFGVDLGRIQVAKSEAQTVADAAAKYAVYGMVNSSSPSATAIANAQAVAAQSKIDGSAPAIVSTDVICGVYDTTTQIFTPNAAGNAVKVTVHQNISRAGAAPMFMRILLPSIAPDVHATAIAAAQTTTVDIAPPASGNLWLSGMPDNTQTQNFRPDNSTVWDNSGSSSSPQQRPLQVSLTGTNIHPGSSIVLEGLTGTASWELQQSGTNNDADGDPTYIVANGAAPANVAPTNSSNGLSNVRAPIGAVMAVFMDDSTPNLSAAPSDLDFGTSAQRDYTTISPALKQVFFVGDGKRSTGESQTIVVPAGATRVFFGMMDAWQWNDNVGSFQTKLYSQSTEWLVK